MLRAINALRCALTNLGTNAWNLIAAVYWFLIGVGQEEMVNEYLGIGYEHICTCQEDLTDIIKGLDAPPEETGENRGRIEYMLSSCSESGAVKQGDNKAKQKERRA